MREGASHLIGNYDFSSFCSSTSNAKTRVRSLRRIDIEIEEDLIIFWFEGEGFLKQMIRNIVGTFVLVGRGKIAPSDLIGILESKDRSRAGRTAPPEGLFLVEVEY